MRRRGMLAALLALPIGAHGADSSKTIVLRNDDSRVVFSPPGPWAKQRGANTMSNYVMWSDDSRATITISLPADSAAVQWYSIRQNKAATYLVCIDCVNDEDWQTSFLVDARGVSTASSLIWTSKSLDSKVNHTMAVRNVVDPRYNMWSTLCLDALVVQTGDGANGGTLTPGTSSDSSQTPSVPKRYLVPVIVLSIIGGLALLATIAIVGLWYLRRRRAARSPSTFWHDKYTYQDIKPNVGPEFYAYDTYRSGRSQETAVLEISPSSTKSRKQASEASVWSHRINDDLPPLPTSPKPIGRGSVQIVTTVPTLSPSSPQPRSTFTSPPSAHPRQTIPTPANYPDQRLILASLPQSSPPASSHSPLVALPYVDPFEQQPRRSQQSSRHERVSTRQDLEPVYAGQEIEPPAPQQTTFAAALAHRENSGNSIDATSSLDGSCVPPLPFTLPPTRPVSIVTTEADIPLPDFDLVPSQTPPLAPARTQSSVRPPHRKPLGPRVVSGIASLPPPSLPRTLSNVTVPSIVPSIPEETDNYGAGSRQSTVHTSNSESPLTPNHPHPMPRRQSKGLPELPFNQFFASPTSTIDDEGPSMMSAIPSAVTPSAITKGKGPARQRPPIQIAVGGARRARGMSQRAYPSRKSTAASTASAMSPGGSSRAPTLLRWEPDFLEVESTPFGTTMVTVGSEPQRQRSGSSTQAPLSPNTPVQDSPLDVGISDDDETEEEAEAEDGVLTMGHWFLPPIEASNAGSRQNSGPAASSVRSGSGGTVASTMRRMLTGDASARYHQLNDS